MEEFEAIFNIVFVGLPVMGFGVWALFSKSVPWKVGLIYAIMFIPLGIGIICKLAANIG